MNQWEDFSFVDVHSYRVKLQAYEDELEEFCTQLDETRHRVCETVRLYEFFDKVRQGICCIEEGVKSLLGLSPARLFMKRVKCSICSIRELDL